MFPSFLKKDGDKILFNGSGELVYYVPEKYFETSQATIYGDTIEVMGVFDYDVFESNGKHRGMKNFYYPTTIQCKPSSTEKVSEFAITKDIKMDYRLLKFKKDDEVISNINIPKAIGNAEKFINLLISGNLPPTIPYNKLHEYINYNAELNGFGYGMTAQMLGVIVSELCRDKNDLTRPFRLTDMKDQLAYTMVSIKMLPKFISPYVAITSENADESIANAMMNKTGAVSPLEKVMMN